MFWEVVYIVRFNNEARVKWRISVARKRVADAIVEKYPWATATKRKHRGETIEIQGSGKRDIERAIALVSERA